MSGRLVMGFVVLGDLATQGSKNAFPIYRGSKAKGTRQFTGKVAVTDDDPKLKAWRKIVTERARDARRELEASAEGWECLSGPVRVQLTFSVRAPKRIPKARHGWPAVKPDVDKYVRAVLDSLTDALVWSDDGQAVIVRAVKLYDVLPAPGVMVELYRLDEHTDQAARQVAWASPVYQRFLVDNPEFMEMPESYPLT